MAVDQDRARAVQLGFKKATSGLSPDEEQELAQLNQKIAMQNAGIGGS